MQTAMEYAARAGVTQPHTSLEGLRVLLVEDSWIVAQSLKSMLELLGVDIIGPAASLADATELADAERFDIAIMDLDLQGEMSDALIADLHDRHIPVVIVTGNPVAPETGENAVAALQKPIRVEALLRKLREVRAAALA